MAPSYHLLLTWNQRLTYLETYLETSDEFWVLASMSTAISSLQTSIAEVSTFTGGQLAEAFHVGVGAGEPSQLTRRCVHHAPRRVSR